MEKIDREILFNKIKESKVSQKELAQSVGISKEHLNSVLKGRLPLTNTMYKRINYWYEQLRRSRKHN